MSAALVKSLRASLRYADRAGRREILALIAEAERQNETPERAAVADPEPKPCEPQSDEGDDQAGRPGETNARPSAAADPRPVGPVCQETRAQPGAPAERVEAPQRICARSGFAPAADLRPQRICAHSGFAPAAARPSPPLPKFDQAVPVKSDAGGVTPAEVFGLAFEEHNHG